MMENAVPVSDETLDKDWIKPLEDYVRDQVVGTHIRFMERLPVTIVLGVVLLAIWPVAGELNTYAFNLIYGDWQGPENSYLFILRQEELALFAIAIFAASLAIAIERTASRTWPQLALFTMARQLERKLPDSLGREDSTIQKLRKFLKREMQAGRLSWHQPVPPEQLVGLFYRRHEKACYRVAAGMLVVTLFMAAWQYHHHVLFTQEGLKQSRAWGLITSDYRYADIESVAIACKLDGDPDQSRRGSDEDDPDFQYRLTLKDGHAITLLQRNDLIYRMDHAAYVDKLLRHQNVIFERGAAHTVWNLWGLIPTGPHYHRYCLNRLGHLIPSNDRRDGVRVNHREDLLR